MMFKMRSVERMLANQIIMNDENPQIFKIFRCFGSTNPTHNGSNPSCSTLHPGLSYFST